MTRAYVALLLTVFLGVVSYASPIDGATNRHDLTISIVLEPGHKSGQVRYKVLGAPVRSDKLLDELGALLIARGRDNPVAVLMDDRVYIAELWNIKGLIDKVGFLNDRYFAFTRGGNMMGEIKFGKAVPYSLNP